MKKKIELDRLDRAILQTLQEDAAISVGELADRIHLSKTACWHRLKRLREDGVIRKTVALLDADKLGLGLTAYIAVRTREHNEVWSNRFRQVVADIPEILEVYRTSGEVDYLIKAVIGDVADYDRLYQKLIKAELSDVSASFAMEIIKTTTALPVR